MARFNPTDPFQSKRSRFSLAIALCLAPLVNDAYSQNATPPLVLPAGEEAIWGRIEERYWDSHQRPTEPSVIERLIAPWEPTRAVTLALPLGQFSEQVALRTMFQDTLAAALPRFEVVAFYHRLDEPLLGTWLHGLEGDERTAPYLDRLHLLASDAYSIWMRDFGPQFALGENGRIVVLDASMLDGQASLENLMLVKSQRDPIEQHLRMVDEISTLQGIIGTDRAPSLLASFLEARWHVETELSRPPLVLQGGDFVLGDEETAFISYSTLQVNGGRAREFRSVMKDYYGIERVVFLENLPGKTIDHLDFTIHPIRKGVTLVADAPRGLPLSRSFHRYLDRELKRRAAENRRAVEAALPQGRVLRLPMPPPLLDSDETVRRENFLKALQAFAEAERIALRIDPVATLENWDRFKLDPRIEAKLLGDIGLSDLDTPQAMDRVIERYLGRSFAEVLESHVESQVDYRSYANSLYVENRKGEGLLLLPRYQPRDESERSLLASMEIEVEAVYRDACPDAELIWIDCTTLTGFLGVIHCYTGTIPDFEAIR